MGNENSKSNELTKNGTIPEKHENGSVNGVSASITSNGLDFNGETVVKTNGGPLSLNHAIELTEPDCVVVESVAQKAEALVISETPETPATPEKPATPEPPATPATLEPPATPATPEPAVKKEEAKKNKGEKARGFGNMFKKKAGPPAEPVEKIQEKEIPNDNPTDVSVPAAEPQPETANLNPESESLTEPESVTLDQSSEEEKAPETDNGNSQPVEIQVDSLAEENPVMNFFKTLVTPKTAKKETATPDATKDQSQKESQPAATTTVAQVSEPPAAPKGMSIPPPPPPEPPKMEVKGEPAAKPVKPTPKEEPKAAAKEPEASKGKSAKDTLSKFFRSKVQIGIKAPKGKGASASGANAPAKTAPVTNKEEPQPAVEVEVQPVVEVQETPVEVPEPVVEVQSEQNVEAQETAEEVAQLVVEEQKVDPSKASTLEATPKPEPPPPVQEEKKAGSKSSFLSLFKPKVLLDRMTTKVQAASTSGVRLLRKTTGVAADPKKATPAPAAAGEAAQAAKAKEEPKAAAKSSEAVVDKPASAASQSGDDAANVPKKLEKRNSIQLFFKILGQKRNSTDAGIQTEQGAIAQPAEKAK
ncbi:breast carcinoma-amplified sequence 1 isoform X4 [Larimichthys crocea]|uniref:breast carcinoma-amplified sequence 1 isoform X4 n=1 Tax=Larimichthys crocea TaxID=215358 RepID=UPI000F602C61|nr:proteoglycan 4 isoform X4 [Larimichthys crocea]